MADSNNNAAADQLYGGGGDTLGVSGVMYTPYMEGGSGDDLLDSFEAGVATLLGGGNDLLGGSAVPGVDRLDGGDGDDWVLGELPFIAASSDLMTGGLGRDGLYGLGDNDTLYGGDGDESGGPIFGAEFLTPRNPGLFGGAGDDWLDGGNGDDVVDGGAGADTLIGGFGNDTVLVDNPGDLVFEGAGGGVDTVHVVNTIEKVLNSDFSIADQFISVTSGTFALPAYAEVEIFLAGDPTLATAINLVGSEFANQITGNAGANTLSGLGGSDDLKGLAGKDRLKGGAGLDRLDGGGDGDTLLGEADADRLHGGDGNDTLEGGDGKDVFVFKAAPHRTTNVDRIVDFRWQDDTVHLDNTVLKTVGPNGKL
jgi:Ca2+-binding RTX toxin-like protein